MQVLPVIVPYIKTTSNIAISCKGVRDWLSNNNFAIRTSYRCVSFQNLDYYLSLPLPSSFLKYKLCMFAALNGDIPLLKLVQERGYKWDEYVCVYAALEGRLECLKWLRDCGEALNNTYTCANAAKGGHLEVLKWLREQEFTWDSNVCTYAAWGGHLEVLKWARENGCEWNKGAFDCAEANNHSEVVKWLRENGCPEN